jgi:hypothetical protein
VVVTLAELSRVRANVAVDVRVFSTVKTAE